MRSRRIVHASSLASSLDFPRLPLAVDQRAALQDGEAAADGDQATPIKYSDLAKKTEVTDEPEYPNPFPDQFNEEDGRWPSPPGDLSATRLDSRQLPTAIGISTFAVRRIR